MNLDGIEIAPCRHRLVAFQGQVDALSCIRDRADRLEHAAVAGVKPMVAILSLAPSRTASGVESQLYSASTRPSS
jgi:hypothetical protein